MSKLTLPFGTWKSPLSAAQLSADVRFGELGWDTNSDTLVWLEGRSKKGVLVAHDHSADGAREFTREGSVRAEVGYGGGDFGVHDGRVFYAKHRDGRLFAQALTGGAAQPITPSFGKAASPVVSSDGRWIVYVHHDKGTDRLAVVDADGKEWPRIFASGADFYMQPRWSPDGKHFAFVCWDHPQMPWLGATLKVGCVHYDSNGPPRLVDLKTVAGGPDVAVFQPEWAGGILYYISDETGWGHLWRYELNTGERRAVTNGEVEYGLPAWIQQMRSYALSADGQTAICTRSDKGFVRLVRVDLGNGEEQDIKALADYTQIDQIAASPSSSRIAFIGSASTIPPRIVSHDLNTGKTRILARASTESVPRAALSEGRAMQWETVGGETAHGIFYPPASEGFRGPKTPPPMIVMVHGGPTAQATTRWDPRTQFFTTRGYAVLCINYRGSTGYGRAYMKRMHHDWGVVDVEDVVSAVRVLGERKEIDAKKCVIAGGSAGGYTVLQTMIEAPEVFAAGICFYGVSDLFAIARDTHKFEEHYTDDLVGPLPEAADRYHARSPVFHAHKMRRPLAIFQGADDQVVPKSQGDAIVAALKSTGVPHEYHVYEGEGHGFRRTETLQHFYESMLKFLNLHVIYTFM